MEGMLWYDDTKKKPILEVILDAADAYELKYAMLPDIVLVNIEVPVADFEDIGIRIDTSKYVHKHHVLIGVKDASN